MGMSCAKKNKWKVPSYPCIFWNLMPQCRVKVRPMWPNPSWNNLSQTSISCGPMYDHHAIPAMPLFFIQTLESGSSRSSMPVEQSVVWMWDISRGTMGIIPGLYVTRVAKNISLRGNLTSWTNISPEIAWFTGQLGLYKIIFCEIVKFYWF